MAADAEPRPAGSRGAVPHDSSAAALTLSVALTGQLRQAAPALTSLVVPAGTALDDALAQVAERGGETLLRQLRGSDGRPEPTVIVVVNGRVVGAAERGGFLLADGDEILLMPPIAGG